MSGYQCDKAVNENDTREVIYHFTAVGRIALQFYQRFLVLQLGMVA